MDAQNKSELVGTVRVELGQPHYDGPVWHQLTVHQRILRLRECVKLKQGDFPDFSANDAATLLGAVCQHGRKKGKPSRGIITGYLDRYGIGWERLGRRNKAPTKRVSRILGLRRLLHATRQLASAVNDPSFDFDKTKREQLSAHRAFLRQIAKTRL